jgi:hypothetical protein
MAGTMGIAVMSPTPVERTALLTVYARKARILRYRF